MVAVPLLPPLAAVSVADPGAIAVTNPLPPNVATPALLEVHVMLGPVSTLPLASFSVATSCWVPPTGNDAAPGATLTDATRAAVAVLPVATFEKAPNTAFTFKVPRYVTSSRSYAVPVVRPRTVHARRAPMAVPATGVAQVPRLTLGTDPPHTRGVGASRMS